MKFLIIADMHGNVENLDKLDDVFKSVDGVLCAGDFVEFGNPQTAKLVLEKLVSKHEYIFSVIGNCDDPEFIGEIENQDVSVQKSLVFHQGFAIAGSGGSSIWSKTTPNERTEDDLLSDFEIVENSTQSCADQNGKWSNLVLISHNPPFTQKCDCPCEGVHAGSQKLTQFIKERSPILVATGHIHEGAAIEKIEETTVVNPGALFEGKYAIVEFEKSSNDNSESEWALKDIQLKTL